MHHAGLKLNEIASATPFLQQFLGVLLGEFLRVWCTNRPAHIQNMNDRQIIETGFHNRLQNRFEVFDIDFAELAQMSANEYYLWSEYQLRSSYLHDNGNCLLERGRMRCVREHNELLICQIEFNIDRDQLLLNQLQFPINFLDVF